MSFYLEGLDPARVRQSMHTLTLFLDLCEQAVLSRGPGSRVRAR